MSSSNPLRRAILAAALALVFGSGAASADVRVHGATTVAFGLMKPNKEKIEALAGTAIVLLPSSTTRGLTDLAQGRADIAMLAEPLAGAAQSINDKTPGTVDTGTLLARHVGNAYVQFIVHPGNPVRNLSTTHAVEHFRTNAAARERLQAERTEGFQATEVRGRHIAGLTRAFEAEAATVIAELGTASLALAQAASAMMKAVTDSDTRAHEVAASTGEANSAANAVAAAAEQIHAAIEAIEERIVSAQSIASTATSGARDACGTMTGVVERCRQIGTVVGLIDSIAQETNLLALNATIEAARAGDMGRGFGVVATEVKTLAHQTAKATENVTTQIRALQDASSAGSRAVDDVAAIVARLDEIATAIAQVMRQQSEATREISASAILAAGGTTTVLQSIGGMTEASKRTRGISDDVSRAAADLAAQSERLAGTVRKFLNGLAAA
jgi:methyl-accepting chemotaxis protein